jgi:predicted anti-sigma-YlaC factor YlaD
MWNNPCRWARARLPLWSGGELTGLDRRRVERHVLVCPSCRRRLDQMRAALEVLQTAGTWSPVRAEAGSLWPALARQIQESRRPLPARPWLALWAGAGLAASLFGLAALWIGPWTVPLRVAERGSHPAPAPAAPVRSATPEPIAPPPAPKVAIRDTSSKPKPAESRPVPRLDPDRGSSPALESRETQPTY